MGLFGIESENDCTEKIDELLELHAQAEKARTKETVRAVKSALEQYCRKGNSAKGKTKMSEVEARFFWPAIQEVYVKAPNLNDPRLYEIQLSLRY